MLKICCSFIPLYRTFAAHRGLNELMLYTNCLCKISGWIAKIYEMHSMQLLQLDSTKPFAVCLCLCVHVYSCVNVYVVVCTLYIVCTFARMHSFWGLREIVVVCYNFCKTMSCESLTWNDFAWKVILKFFFNFMHTYVRTQTCTLRSIAWRLVSLIHFQVI